jgi:hypothetical protein
MVGLGRTDTVEKRERGGKCCGLLMLRLSCLLYFFLRIRSRWAGQTVVCLVFRRAQKGVHTYYCVGVFVQYCLLLVLPGPRRVGEVERVIRILFIH